MKTHQSLSSNCGETDKQEGKKLKGETEDMKPAKETNEQHGKVSSAPLV